MTFRQAVLTLAAPVLSVALIGGCQPPLEEKKGDMAAPATTEPATPTPTPTPAPTDVKPTGTTTPAAEPPKDAMTPAPTPAPEEPKKEEPKS